MHDGVADEPKTILIVDDLEDNLEILARRFERKGYAVLRAAGGREALELLAREPIDLVVLDVMMPEVTGLDVLSQLRRTRSAMELPVIVATAQTETGDVVRALDLGANDHVTKPVDFDVLLARVRVQLRQRESLRVTPSSSMPARGLLEAKYELGAKLGTGGFGAVYKARHVALDTFVAVKILHTHLLDSETTRARFTLEGVSACRVRHPNAVAVLDAGTDEHGAPYLVMELLEGPSLLELLAKERVLRVRRAAEIALPVCEVLRAAHEAGVIHRDIKPANILLAKSKRGEVVKVLDFGIAKLMDDVRDSPVTAGGQVIGTPHYMAPERLIGAEIDARSDIFSLGAMLFQMLSARLPFGFASAPPLRQALQQLQGSPLQLGNVRPDLPRELTELVMRCLLYAPSMRPDLAELASTLHRMGATFIEPAWPPPLAADPNEGSEASGQATTIPGSRSQPEQTADEPSGVKPSSIPPPPAQDRLTRPRSTRARRRKS